MREKEEREKIKEKTFHIDCSYLLPCQQAPTVRVVFSP